MYKFSEDVKKKVYETFGRNDQIVEDDVKIIKTWMKTQLHFPEIMEDVKIRNFLNLNKFSVEKTKARIDMYYTIRNVVPELFERNYLKCENLESLFVSTYLFTFPKSNNETHRTYFFKQKKPNTLNALQITNIWLAIFEVRLCEDFMVDDIIIVDFENFTLGDVKKITPTLVSKFLGVYKKVYALRIKKFIYINCPSYISLLAIILKSVMKPKIFERVEFHENDAVLKDVFPENELPKDYGGKGLCLDEMNDLMKEKFLEYQNRFDQVYKLRVNENLRPEKLDNDEILGFYGSFKKINVD